MSNEDNTLASNPQLAARCFVPERIDAVGWGNNVPQRTQNRFRIEPQDFDSIVSTNKLVWSEMMVNLLKEKNPEFTNITVQKLTTTSSSDGTPLIIILMDNEYECRVVSEIIDLCDDQQLALIVHVITQNLQLFVHASVSKPGSTLIKKIIQKLNNSSISMLKIIIRSLCDGFYEIMTDRNGSYIIAHCLGLLDADQTQPIYEAAIRHCLSLATNKRGCISLNNFIVGARGRYRDQLLNLICDNAVSLSQDESGNYVVQKVLSLECPDFTNKISLILRGRYASLSMQKVGSHVVEQIIMKSSLGMRIAVNDLLGMRSSATDKNLLLQVTKNRYGNYVIQRALKVTKQVDGELHRQLLWSLQPYFEELEDGGYGKNVYNLIVNGVPID
ncbi:hypothetical protein K2173_016804 [Erythroxylum novogranatense]|uniref:PUM-HD domain-containing protein n=1 Tax=Erythroxylum novogranatense TaxID=1862640 RepID=A0AAV8SS30_9ROSI|nr:hypothetical protein K2173_016804 [Erythroxylum novogranatense]